MSEKLREWNQKFKTLRPASEAEMADETTALRQQVTRLQAANRDLQAWFDDARATAEQAQARVAQLEEVARESQDWDWLAAKEAAGENEQEFFEIPEMQELWDAVHKGNGE